MEWFLTWDSTNWLILGMVLCTLEIFISGVFLLWWGIAAVIVAGLVFLFPTIPLIGVIYAVLASIFTFVWYKYQHKRDLEAKDTPVLNQGLKSMIGLKGVVEEISAGRSRGKFRDSTWAISGASLSVGDTIEVVGVEGNTLIVKKV